VGNHDVNLTATHRECLILFLQTDPGNAASFGVDASINWRINDFLNNMFRSFTKGKDKVNFFDQIWEENTLSVASSIGDIAKKATKIPFAIFTNLFHYRFKKKSYLESTLELLQQFYIQLDDLSVEYCLFVGDLHKYCLHCTRCHCAITRPDHIFEILEIAPMAMLWHLGMASDLCDIMSQGMRTFCEATKVDLQFSINSKKNQDTTHNTTMVNTLSLILAGNVADMSRHVGDDTTCRSNFGQMGLCRRQKI
jgi:hypothetical protein